jgi:Flp pilus assembly protein TadB
VSVFQALGRKSDFVKRHGKSLKRLLKEIERRERNLKRMNRKTRAVVMGKKP